MIAETGYDLLMRRFGTRLLGLFGGGLAVLFLAPSALPQAASTVASHGPAASVTSNFFGGRNDRAPGVPASVTSSGSLGPHRGTPGPAPFGEHHRHHPGHPANRPGDVVYYPVPYAVPYGSDYADPQAQSADDPEDYRGGPTVFDRRGSGTALPSQDAAAPPASSDAAQNAADPPAEAAPDRVMDQPQTVVVFKDGHQLEMANYAIVGDSLFDLTPGHRHKIALAELDLAATEKENDDRGIDFRLPAGVQGN
jgi:hypothetical protein